MDKIEKIRQFVKELQQDFISIHPKDCSLELIKSYAGYAYLDKVLSFLDTLSEEPDKSMEEAANEYARLDDEGVWKDGGKYRGFIAGAEWQKEQMLKDAVEADVTLTDISLRAGYLPKELGIKYGDKVRIVILKEEEE